MHIAVAGNDIAGLTLALRLRIKGHDVTVHDTVVSSPLDDVFTVIAPYRDLFLKSGEALDDVIGILPVTEPIRSGEVALPPSGAQGPAVASALGDTAAKEWNAFLQSTAAVWAKLRVDAYVPRSSLERALQQSLRSSELRRLAIACLPTPAVDSLSDAAAVFPYLVQTFGLWTFDGGLPRFAHVLRERCTQRGVEFSASPAPTDALTVDAHFHAMFAAPRRWPRRSKTLRTQDLGLPFIGMAAESMAERIGRA